MLRSQRTVEGATAAQEKGMCSSAVYDEVPAGPAVRRPFYRPQKGMNKLRRLVPVTLSLHASTLTLRGLGKDQSILADGAAKEPSRLWHRQTCPDISS